jgi:GNAT superfamily N-acetyltransferase
MSSFSKPEPLHPHHDLRGFTCGKPPLDEFLKRHALDKQNAMLSRTYVTMDGGSVIAYYTLAHIAIAREESPKKIGRGMPSTIPALLLARLAIDERFQRQGLGRALFADATGRAWAVMKGGAAPVRFFVVDAKDEAAKAFYEGFRMLPSPLNPLRLFLSYKDVQSIFEPTRGP